MKMAWILFVTQQLTRWPMQFRVVPDAQVTIGPVIDNGFYYDFSYERPFTPEDLGEN